MSGYRPEDFRNNGLVERVRRARAECGRVTSMPRDVDALGGGMIRERSGERRPALPSFVRPAADPDAALRAMEARLAALLHANGRGQGWVMLTQIICTVVICGTVIATRFIG